MSDLFDAPKPVSNVPELSVAELAFALKRTLEESFGRVRVRGELSGVKIAASGHLYASIKDQDACIDVVCWRGSMAKLSIRPEDGLEVICTGRITTYPARSNYQLVIETMELAGQGALLKMLEDRKKKLAAEGLFAPERKRPLPFLPRVIGVVTSPTGAVIRDILHRVTDRFPAHVLVWSVQVQGESAARQVAAAIEGFNALGDRGGVPRPDLLIVARGGGSLEDLMPFNEEIVVRAAAASRIPLISAVGHETDTTLIDFAADRRAPTPTGAAEMAVPERSALLAQVLDDGMRLRAAIARVAQERRTALESRVARLADPRRVIEMKTQALDHSVLKLSSVFERGLVRHRTRVADAAAALTHPRARMTQAAQVLDHTALKLSSAFERGLNQYRTRVGQGAAALVHPRAAIAQAAQALEFRQAGLARAGARLFERPAQDLAQLARMLETLSFRRTLQRGFALVRRADGAPETTLNALTPGQAVTIEFFDGGADATIGAIHPVQSEKGV